MTRPPFPSEPHAVVSPLGALLMIWGTALGLVGVVAALLAWAWFGL